MSGSLPLSELAQRFPALAEVLTAVCIPAGKVTDRSMARNLLCDHRIPPDRLKQLQAAGPLANLQEIEEAVQEYQYNQVRPPKQDRSGTPGVPAYARPENAINAVTLEAGTMLGTVLNLTRLGRVYEEANKTFKLPEFARFEITDPRSSAQVNDQLEAQLNNAAKRAAFLDAIFRACARYRRNNVEKQIHLTWAAEWNSLAPFLDRTNPDHWLHAVGVPTEDPAWIAVVQYALRRGKKQVQLFRPTQLDAGWYAHHFPSPPKAAVQHGGYAMFLRQNAHAPGPKYGLVSEYIHERIDFRLRDWELAGGLLAYVDHPVGGDLEIQRRAHWELLETNFGAPVRDWMPEFL